MAAPPDEITSVATRLALLEQKFAVHDAVCTQRGRVLWTLAVIVFSSSATFLVNWLLK